jgi:NADH-quinone oxidoreductase subunit D/NADH-quinone oxidoreductase subunit C/D
VLRLLVKLEGEKVLNVQPHSGYIHSGIEKMCEAISYPQIIHLTDRMDYLSAHMNNEAVALCVEKALQIEENIQLLQQSWVQESCTLFS